ncbi:MAG: type II toxin-antitoxin system RelB/DinJ family antitoxin [Microvirga sp.]
MSKTSVVRARIEPELKEGAERILSEVGLTPSTAVGILYRRIISERGFPISLKMPNETTRAALEDAMLGRNLKEIHSIYDILEEDDEEGEPNEPVQERPEAGQKTGPRSKKARCDR